MDGYDIARIVALVMVGVLLIGPAFISTNLRLSVFLRNLALWLGIAVVISLLYRWMG